MFRLNSIVRFFMDDLSRISLLYIIVLVVVAIVANHLAFAIVSQDL